MLNERQKKIGSIFINNGISSTIVIPKETAKKYVVDRHFHATIEDEQEGILIKTLEIK
ncbi:MAG TPA: hypothetical protein VH481_11290 [Nitrososphaeraceae archaeon]|jgi:hypothetical protein